MKVSAGKVIWLWKRLADKKVALELQGVISMCRLCANPVLGSSDCDGNLKHLLHDDK